MSCIFKFAALNLFLLWRLSSSTAEANRSSQPYDYKDALSMSLRYLEAQRSGHLPYNQRVTWRSHSGLTDGLDQGVDLVGGYHDAGDHVKFGLPMAFTVTMLSWSAIEYGNEIAAAGEYDHLLEAIKWGTDYFIKAHTQPDVLWVQVGEGETDHYCWQRPEDMTTPRRAYKVDPEHPGSDVAGETAAAMAAASIVFRTSNPLYSLLLLRHAQQLFEFADKYRGKYDQSIKAAKGYYPSWSGYEDELLWAAIWLQQATGKAEYLEFMVTEGERSGSSGWEVREFSWDLKYPGVQIMAAKLLAQDILLSEKQRQVLEQYKHKAEYYLCACLSLNNITNILRTPGGLLFVRQWNNMQYVATAAFLLSVYSDHLTESSQVLHCADDIAQPKDLHNLARSQIEYILGSNPLSISYLVGYGPKYPKHVHHRASSIISYKKHDGFIGCMQGYYNWYGRRRPNPNIIYGALVGGPGVSDNFKDSRKNYMQTEACTYNTAPLIGVLAKLHYLETQNATITSEQSSVVSQSHLLISN